MKGKKIASCEPFPIPNYKICICTSDGLRLGFKKPRRALGHDILTKKQTYFAETVGPFVTIQVLGDEHLASKCMKLET